MKNLLTMVLGLTFTVGAINTHAALVDHGDFFTDTVSGFDWLKLNMTNRKTYDTVVSQMGVGQQYYGWQYATGAQFDALLLGQGIVATSPACSNGYSFCENTDSGSVNAEAALILANLFRNVGPAGATTNSKGLLADVAPTDAYGMTYHYSATIVAFNLFPPADIGLTQIYSHDTAYEDSVIEDLVPRVGSYLIRPSAVPIPASLPLFASGLFGVLGLAKRRTKTT